MAKRSFSTASSSFSAIADTTNLTSGNIMGIQAANSTSMVNVLEISVSGQASASTLANGLFARNSTAAATLTTPLVTPFADGALYSQSSATFAGVYTASTTVAQRSAVVTLARLNLSLNGFGGIYRWVAAPGEEWSIYGVAASADSGFSLTTAGSGATCALGVHIVYEPI
jgi:hypothetical protein